MIWQLDVLFILCAVVSSVGALAARDLLSAVAFLSAFSFIMCLLWTGMGAVDVAFTEAAVGAGISTAFFVAAIYNTTRRTRD